MESGCDETPTPKERHCFMRATVGGLVERVLPMRQHEAVDFVEDDEGAEGAGAGHVPEPRDRTPHE
jgi:hypothetical protein